MVCGWRVLGFRSLAEGDRAEAVSVMLKSARLGSNQQMTRVGKGFRGPVPDSRDEECPLFAAVLPLDYVRTWSVGLGK